MSDYPTDEELEVIKNWDANDPKGLLEHVRLFWKYADNGYFKVVDGEYRLSTGGWSGNEDIIGALRENHLFWAMHWFQSTRGGHYVFCRRHKSGGAGIEGN